MNRDLIESLGFSPTRENLVFLAGSVVGGNKTKKAKDGNLCHVKRRGCEDQPTIMNNSWK